MPPEILPPAADPEGPELAFAALVDSFLAGARAGYSEALHIEDELLLLDRMIPLAVRLGGRSLLVRADVRGGSVETKRRLEEHLRAEALRLIEAEAALGDIAAIQKTGIRGGVWDLWGEDDESALDALRRAAAGDDPLAFEAIGDLAPGMTLDELLKELDQNT